MTVLRNADKWDKSNVLFQEGHLLEYNKQSPRSDMEYIDYGLGVVSAKVFAQYPTNEQFDLADVYQCLSKGGDLAGFEVFERFYEIGSHRGLQEAQDFFTKDIL